MFERLLALSAALLVMGAPVLAEPIGVFDNAMDIGNPKAIGSTVISGSRTGNGLDTLTEEYLLTGGGGDIWGTADQFHFAYRELSGDVRISSSFDLVVGNNTWTKFGVMLRDLGADGDAVSYQTITRRDRDLVAFQRRASQGAGAGTNTEVSVDDFVKLGVQRVSLGDYTVVEGLVDYGSGWESMGIELPTNLPDQIGAGVVLTSHDNNWAGQVKAYDVQYSSSPELVAELTSVGADTALAEQCSEIPGFKIRSGAPLVSEGWGYDAMNEFLDTGMLNGLPAVPGSEGTRISEFVNLHDTGGRGAFSEENGYADESYPGIDPFESPTADPAAGDDDDSFATQVDACIFLTAGAHIIGANSDDGTIIEIGGVEVGRAAEWKGTSNVDFLFTVEADGWYSLRARSLEGSGGGALELHEVLADGTRILLGDVANGGSPVFVPEPATIALLGLGGLALIRRRRS